ncbi:MAG: bifunctional (p)ppGpp synthetase/guanosine-3',5'-bis(diphosphate) 3'-pyrophosphohydrolase [Muribaculaceae bacterium]|nr:bifunctional (p)ppGpp synthetase/guanosine-3',5'-bis(diphosphate) 3'-pyrophosphohydrolase [Muribaculaceae bacterium]MEE1298752.1 RelA/SpoT family protein [Muribaculaceae bacterium]
MMETQYFTDEEKILVKLQYKTLLNSVKDIVSRHDINRVHRIIRKGVADNHFGRDKYGINPSIRHLITANTLVESFGADRNMIIAIMLYNLCKNDYLPESYILKEFGSDIAKLVKGLLQVSSLYKKRSAVESENYHKLLLTFAEDIRVIIIMTIDRLSLMRMINHHPDTKFVKDIANEAKFLYAPLAHRLGLYKIKSELEDLSLKYTKRDTFTEIANKLNRSKVKRDEYIANFIAPVKEALLKAGLNFEIKGRTKSINSIYNKMVKQNADVDDIYDLFAIRIIIDTAEEKEKTECWVAYSIVTDLYKANPARLKDWLTIPKSNGYESLHITVYGPENQWVEVQIRSRRMDEIAEKGLAAHWKYKGIKSESNLDTWMNNIRDLLEAGKDGNKELIKEVKMDIYDKEVFVFTPKGDLYKLPQGATLLDFAFHIHSKLGCSCTGGKVNGKNQKITYRLQSGDTIEILTSTTQTPKLDWLSFVVTSKARNKIKQAVNEMHAKVADLGKELLQRRFKNRKIDVEEALLMRTIRKLGYKTVTDFHTAIANETMNVNDVIDTYIEIDSKDNETATHETAANFVLQPTSDREDYRPNDILVIGENMKGINYSLCKCCNPIFGDDVTGYISSSGAIKIHRSSCTNIKHLLAKDPNREIKATWSGKIGSQFAVTLRILGNDDIGIVTNITSVITKEKDTTLRNISIDSNDGLFQGYMVIGVGDKATLNNLIKKIRNIKGVKDVQRSNN